MRALLEATAIAKAYAGVRALKGVSFDLRAGEVHALVGENGAGKSTLIKIITGVVTPDAGRLFIGGKEIEHNAPALAHSLGVAAIYQQPSLFPHLTVAENIGLALERGGPWRRVNWNERNKQSAVLLARIGSSIEPRRLAGTLSMPEQQMVEIAKALGSGARILIMDEPTSSLADREADRLFGAIESLRAQSAGVIYISHRLDEIFRIADRITVLRDGESIATGERAQFDRPGLIELMAGRPVTAVYPQRDALPGEIALELRDIRCAASGLRDISLTLRRGEILGLAGLVGSGRTELAETIFGLRPADSGEIFVDGRPLRIDSPTAAIEAKLAYVPEDRRRHGVVLDMPVAANTSLASLGAVSQHGWISGTRERRLAEKYVQRLAIKTPSVDIASGALSGGNQQKVALARWLATDPSVLILDEPTQGVDVASKAEIHRIMADLAGRGLAVLMISSELEEILGMSDRIAVMRAGAVAGFLSRAEATPQNILSLALGHAPS